MIDARCSRIPATLDGASWTQLEPWFQFLAADPIEDSEGLEQWLLDRSELDAALSEARADLYIRTTTHTDDAEAGAAWGTYLAEVHPHAQRGDFLLDRRQVELMELHPCDAGRWGVLDRATRSSVDLFREENLPLEVQLAELSQKWQELSGAQTVLWDGAQLPVAQVTRALEETDRPRREKAWRAIADRQQEDTLAVDDIYDQMITLRDQVGRQAGHSGYRDFRFRELGRFDYTPADCQTLHQTIEKEVVPLVRAMDQDRRSRLDLSALRPWDMNVDPDGLSPLRPFDRVPDLIDGVGRIFAGLDPELRRLYKSLTQGDCLDLGSRAGKAPGGYQYMRKRSGRPFIFMNAAGRQRDVQTLLHEAGHAFHSLLCLDEPICFYRSAPIEMAEVASMAMELLSMPHWGVFYEDEATLQRARRQHLKETVGIMPVLARADAFQHWIYADPGHTRAQRRAVWRELTDVYGRDIDATGLEEELETGWQSIPHLFQVPFYMVEYIISGLGALQMWEKALTEGSAEALAAYKQGLALGGTLPLPELYAAMGIRFDFSAGMVRRLVDAVARELDL